MVGELGHRENLQGLSNMIVGAEMPRDIGAAVGDLKAQLLSEGLRTKGVRNGGRRKLWTTDKYIS